MPISKVIAKARPEFEVLNFDVLRAEGISHLENFATELWTDYNAHDPGITLLELLCYAITDLGYRTRMIPVKDILTGPTADAHAWFTAAEILPSSPVTRLDYRKWLIDTEGVKNAWVQPAVYHSLQSTGVVFPALAANAATTNGSTPRSSDDTREYNDVVFDMTKLASVLEHQEEDVIGEKELMIGNVPVTAFQFGLPPSATTASGVLLIDDAFLELVAAALNDEIAIKASFPAIKEYVEQLELLSTTFAEIAEPEIRNHLAQKKRILTTVQMERLMDNMERAEEGAVLPNTGRLKDDPEGDKSSRLRAETDNLRDLNIDAMKLLEEAVADQLPVFSPITVEEAIALFTNVENIRNRIKAFIENRPRDFEIVDQDDDRRNPDDTANYDRELDQENRILEAALAIEASLLEQIGENLSLTNSFLSSDPVYTHMLAATDLSIEERTIAKNYLNNPDPTSIDVTKAENFYILNTIRSLHNRIAENLPLAGGFVLDTNAPLSELAVHLLKGFRNAGAVLETNYWPSFSWIIPTDWEVPRFTQVELKTKRQRLVQDFYKTNYATDAEGNSIPTGNLEVFEEVMEFLHHSLPLKEIFEDQDFITRFYTAYGNTWGKRDQIGVNRFLSDAFPGLKGAPKLEAVEAIVDYFDGRGGLGNEDDDKSNEVLIAEYIMNEQFCAYGHWGLAYSDSTSVGDDHLPLNGLYHILLDLDEDIDTGIPNQVTPVLKRVKDRLHANRGLSEDYVRIDVVEQRPVSLCINLEVDPSADEVDIAAEAIRRMQEYLSPVPRFRTFAQRLSELQAAGENCSAEQIFDGPCLDNGFLVNEELGDDWLNDRYYHSDLLNEIMSVDGILGLPVLRVNPMAEVEASDFVVQTEYSVYPVGGDFPAPGAATDGSYAKPVIDLDKSFIQVKKGARTYRLNMQQVADRLQLFRLINAPVPLGPVGGPEWEPGTHRPDLSDHRSIQYDLPANYLVGDNPPAADASPERRAQSRQLQGFLAFFDQILASYLHQLGQVRQMLSVEQDAEAATWALPLMYEMPGLRDLIGHRTPFTATPDDWTAVLDEIRDDLQSISKGQGNTDKLSDRTLATEWLTDYLDTTTEFSGFLDLRDALKAKLSVFQWSPTAVDHFASLYVSKAEAYFWKQFQADPENRYAQEMRALAESPAEQQYRKNRLLDHLLARFGESFSEFATALLRPEAEPEDNPRQQSFEEYLKAKTTFLREIADLAKGRSLGYNYLQYRAVDNAAEVWNTANVSGLQQRVVRKLGMSSWETRSLSAEPDYRIDRIKKTNRRGMTNHRAALRRRIVSEEDNPRESVPLMLSPPYNSPRVAQDKINELYKHIWQAEYKTPEDTVPENEDYYWFRLSPVGRGGKYRAMLYRNNPGSKKEVRQGPEEEMMVGVEVVLQSELLSEDEARNRLLDEVIPLTRAPQTDRSHEGFHIVEHILLRPLEADDPLLQLSLGCVPEETPKDPYSFWITVVVPADTTRFADPDFRVFFEHTFRMETPAHIAVRFCYLNTDDMYQFEEAFAVWMFEKAKCDPPNYCREDVARGRLVELLNTLPCACSCEEEEAEPVCG